MTRRLCAALAALAIVAATPVAAQISQEPGIDRKGGDYRNFAAPSAADCMRQCVLDAACKAYTFVLPNTIQGPEGRCWLKNTVPGPQSATCCVSGVKAGDTALDPNAYPAGCAITRDGRVEPRASLLVVNRGEFSVRVVVNNVVLGDMAKHENRRFDHVLLVGSNEVSLLMTLARPGGDTVQRSRNMPIRVLNNGPRTCQDVREVIAD
jgi:hypothetical protein